MLDKINLYFTKQTISQCVFIDLFDHFYASVFIFDGLKDELMQGRPDPVLKCPEQVRQKTHRDCVSCDLGQDISV